MWYEKVGHKINKLLIPDKPNVKRLIDLLSHEKPVQTQNMNLFTINVGWEKYKEIFEFTECSTEQ